MSDYDKHPAWLSAFLNNSLHLILFVTEQCNFRCVYCYEDFKLGKIEDKVVRGVKNLIQKRIGELKSLTISYFGGEPLLNTETVIDISSWAQELCKKHSVSYGGGITTNGYGLHKAIFDKLIECGVSSYQVTLDGDKESHDKLRPTLNGKPTFEKIFSNLSMMAESTYQFYCTFRLNLADYNYPAVENFLKQYSYPFAKDNRFHFHFHPIWGMPELVLTKKEQLKELQSLAKSLNLFLDGDMPYVNEAEGKAVNGENNNNEIIETDASMNNKGRSTDYVCYAAKADSYSIRANGRI